MKRKKKFWARAKERAGQAFSILILVTVLLGAVVIVPVGYLSVLAVMLMEEALKWLQKLSNWIAKFWEQEV